MNILFNFSTLKKGGGQNVGLNFLNCFLKDFKSYENVVYIAVRNSKIHQLLIDSNCKNIYLFSSKPIVRFFQELFCSIKIFKKHKIDIVYTYFGYSFFLKKNIQVSGVAVSNVFFPEIDFWKSNSKIVKLKKYIVDKYRLIGIKRANGLIFENNEMLLRAKSLFGLTETVLIKPSFSISPENTYYEKLKNITAKTKVLFFCGWQKNKNYLQIPELALNCKNKNLDIHFVITANDDDSNESIEFKSKLNQYNVKDFVSIVGEVDKSQIPSLYEQIDFVFLLSNLESFSNNIIESWYFKKILVVSNQLWSKSICEDSAVYVDSNNVSEITDKLVELLNNESLKEDIIKKASSKLQTYPTIYEKTMQELNYLKYVYEKNC